MEFSIMWMYNRCLCLRHTAWQMACDLAVSFWPRTCERQTCLPATTPCPLSPSWPIAAGCPRRLGCAWGTFTVVAVCICDSYFMNQRCTAASGGWRFVIRSDHPEPILSRMLDNNFLQFATTLDPRLVNQSQQMIFMTLVNATCHCSSS